MNLNFFPAQLNMQKKKKFLKLRRLYHANWLPNFFSVSPHAFIYVVIFVLLDIASHEYLSKQMNW